MSNMIYDKLQNIFAFDNTANIFLTFWPKNLQSSFLFSDKNLFKITLYKPVLFRPHTFRLHRSTTYMRPLVTD